MLGPIYHWTYASQYLKTCLLTRGILKRAILLFQRNKTVIDEHDLNSQWFEFVQKNETIDVTLNYEKSRAKKIRKIFLFIDIVMIVMMLCSEYFLFYEEAT